MAETVETSKAWQNYLYQHPIFFKDAKEEYLQEPSYTAHDPDKFKGKCSCLAFSKGILFVAMGSKIRALNLANFHHAWEARKKNNESLAWLQDVNYSTLSTPPINFVIRSFVINSKAQSCFIAVAGDYELAVVAFPELANLEWTEEILCKTYLIGAFYHVIGASPISKVLWHPLSEKGSHLVVLTLDGVLRLYNFRKNIDEPESVFPIVQSSKKRGRFGCDLDDAPEAVSFCFGKGTNDWGEFTVYVLMKNSDIYSICPILPDRSVCQKSHLGKLACLVNKKLIESQKGKNYAQFQTQYQNQMAWVSAIMDQINTTPHDGKVVISPPTVHECVQPQGPYLLRPSPIELSSIECTVDASDILYLETEPVNVLAIVVDNGRVDICLEVERVEGCWESSSPLEGLPVLVVYECIDLGLSKIYRQRTPISSRGQHLSLDSPCLVPDPYHKDTFYVQHAGGAHAVIIGRMLHDFKRFFDKSHQHESEEYIFTESQAEVHWLVAMMPSDPDPLIGLCTMSSIQLGYCLFMLTTSFILASQELILRKPVELTSHLGIGTPPRLNEIPRKLKELENFASQFQILSSRNRSNQQLTIEDLDFFLGEGDKMRAKIKELEGSASTIKQWIQAQSKDIRQQVSQLEKIRRNIIESKEHYETITIPRLLDMIKRQEELNTKTNIIIHKLLPTDYQQRYLVTYEEMNKEIEALNLQIQKIEARHKNLKPDYQVLLPRRKNRGTLANVPQLDKVYEAVGKETKIISSSMDKLETIIRQMKELGISEE